MACKISVKRKGKAEPIVESINQKNLVEKGRVQFFYHSPSSTLPIRDVLNEQREGAKTEPHIEIGAENYLAKCYQNNIIDLINNNEQFLFLFTTCRHKKMLQYGKKFIVGYIDRTDYDKIGRGKNSRYYIKGKTYLYEFSDSISLSKLGYSEGTRRKCINEKDCHKILNHFKNKKNIVKKCIDEIISLDKTNETCPAKKGKKCPLQKQCPRWNS